MSDKPYFTVKEGFGGAWKATDTIHLGKGNLYIGDIKYPRSKKKRIRNKWMKRQRLGRCECISFTTVVKSTDTIVILPPLNKNEVALIWEKRIVEPVPNKFNFTLDDISEEDIRLLMSGDS